MNTTTTDLYDNPNYWKKVDFESKTFIAYRRHLATITLNILRKMSQHNTVRVKSWRFFDAYCVML